LGSYRLEPSGAEQMAEENAPSILTTLAVPQSFDNEGGGQKENEQKISIQSTTSKKSVRFKELDTPEIWLNEDFNKSFNQTKFGITLKEMVKKTRKALSWKNLRLMVVQLVLMTISGNTGNIYFDYFCTYLSWLGYTELLVICSAIFVHYVAPQAIGSGIPEMKCSLRGDYLAARTLISKIVGLTFSLAASTANLLSNVAARFEGAYGNECRKSEMLAAACATGVACCFSAPIGGVLFSIETTTMHFSVRNYWRGFFAAACGATVFRLLRVVAFETEVTLVAFYQTHFPEDAFEPEELPFFALIGLLCGFIGAGFIVFYRSFVIFLRQNSFVKEQIPIIAFLVATVTYPRGYGRFLSGRYKFTRTVIDFFSNCTWSKGLRHPIYSPHGCHSELLGSWSNHEGYGPYNVFLVLTLFAFTFLLLSALCNTMPIPCGMFMPLFVVGAAFGRLIGEIISSIFPDGIPGGTDQPIFPGIYAVVGAASLTGAITHSVSVAMICCEITGQLIYIIPLMVRYICRVTKFEEIRKLIIEMPKLRSFPVVDDPTSLMLLGSISRRTILEILNAQIGEEARKREAERRIRIAIETIDKHFREAQMDETKSDSECTAIGLTKLNGQERLLEDLDKEEEDGRRRVFSHGAYDMNRTPNGDTKNILDKPNKRMVRCSLSEGALVQKKHYYDDSKRKKSKENKFKKEQQKMSICSQIYPVIEQKRDNNIAFEDNKDGNSSRFVVEPVISTKRRNLSSGQLFPSVRAVRRNAFALMPWKTISDSDESSEAGTSPPKKISCPDLKMATMHSQWGPFDHQLSLSKNISEYVRSVKRKLRMMQNKHLAEPVDYDLHDDERREWELAKLCEEIEIEEKLIDPAPFQLVRRTSVYKVHSLFSLLDLNRAYVTDRGRLVGVVALRDLRIAIQKSQSGLPMYRSNLDTLKEKRRNSVFPAEQSVNISSNNFGRNSIQDIDLEGARKLIGNGHFVGINSNEVYLEENNKNMSELEEENKGIQQEQTTRPASLQIIREEFEPKELNNGMRLRLGSRIFESQTSSTPLSEHISPTDPNNVAQAVEYLRRRSVAVEDLKTLEETPLPEVIQDLQKEME
uniref:Chloride channel protein n=1 Tax=Meloidogyne javanica TaxID=6303 RepID=A0A915LKM8_MELJA